MTPEESQNNRLLFIDEISTHLRRDHSGIIAILKAHLFAEQMLNAILKGNLRYNDTQLESCRLTFYQKIKLVIAQENLSSEVEKSLIALNRVRNKCAHDFHFEITEIHWADIYSPFAEEMPYPETVSDNEDQKWLRWAGWLLGLLFPTADVYVKES